MSWLERIYEQKWVESFLPNYLKPLNDSAVETEQTKELVKEAEEFISDLSTLSELPRLNKTFKRNIKGYLFKVKIKQKKIYLEMLDTKKSSASIKKRIYITIFRKQFKTEKGMGKCADSTIYYTEANRTIVRNVRKHPYFQPVFLAMHRLDLSLSGPLPREEEMPSLIQEEKKETTPGNDEERDLIIDTIDDLKNKYKNTEPEIIKNIQLLQEELLLCLKDIELLDIEEKHHIKRLVGYDLPNLLKTYSTLSRDQKKSTYNEVINTIKSMHTYIENQTYQIQNSRMDRMNQLLKLNQMRYEENNSQAKKDAD